MDLKETDILGSAIHEHWYYRAKASAIQHLIGRNDVHSILDVGAGSGFFSRHLLANTNASSAWCVDNGYAGDSDDQERDKPIYFRRAIDRVNADLVLMMDVLEHVDDDIALLREYISKVPSWSRFLISVPAFQFLWSNHDTLLEHKRRYRVEELEHTLQKAGLQEITGVYYFAAIFPLAAGLRLAERFMGHTQDNTHSQLKIHHPVTNRLLGMLCAAELPLIQWNRLFGLTAICLARKP